MSRIERVAVFVVVFLSGALLMSLEVAAFRIIGKTFGSALRETTAVIAVFLAAMSIGYWVGGRAGDRWPKPETLIAVLLSAAALLFAVPWLDVLISPRVAASNLELSAHAFVATSLLFAIPTILFATVSPIAVRLFATDTGRSGSTAGSISAISTAGSIAGSVITAFVLIDWLASIARTVLTVGLMTCIAALLLMLAMIPRLHQRALIRPALRRYAFVVAAILLLGVPAVAFIRSSRIEHSLVAPHPGWRVLFVGDSPYHRVTVRERPGMTRVLTFALGSQSRMSLRDPLGHGADYTDAAHISRLMRPTVRRILVIGLGGGTIPKQFVHYYPDTTVDVVEIDPMVVDVAQKYFGVQQSARLRIHISDGRMFLKRSAETWDLIVIDAYTTNRYGDTIPPHLVTREFFAEASRRLSDGGILHFHCAFGGTRLVPAIQKTIASVFPSTYVTGGEVFASHVALLTTKETALERARSTRAGTLPNLKEYVDGLEPYTPVDAAIPLLTDDYAPVDTLR
ncbi:MAG: fused MFS/spermidine synthase [Acidobacteriota bacterium]|nr:fused MFS/spermidine synthase [Acidobacteriota bacterium]